MSDPQIESASRPVLQTNATAYRSVLDTPSARQYFAKYKKLPLMSSKTGYRNTFGNGVSTHNKSLVSRQSLEILPSMYSFDSPVLLVQRKFAAECNAKFGIDLDKDGFSKAGAYTTWDRMKTVAGYMPSHMSYVPLNNASYRTELGLTPGYTAKERRIAENVWKIVFSSYKPSAIKVPHKSQGGVRRNSVDSTWKFDFAMFLFESPRYSLMLSLIDKGDWLTLANEFEMLFLFYMQKRDQVDTPGKPRLVFDLEYALTSGAKGRAFNTDKSVVIDGQLWDDFSATRARVVHAGPWVINCFLQLIASGHMSAIFERFPTVFHTTTSEQIKSAIDGHYVTCSDVKEYDRSMSKDAIDVPHDVGANFWGPEHMKASRTLYYAPYYSRPLEYGSHDHGIFIGDPSEMGEQVICGNRSGHAWTSLVAKINKVIDTLFIFDCMGLDVEGNELTYLESRGAISFLNNGDDEVVYTKSKALMDSFKKFRYAKGKFGHYFVEEEVGQGFSGLLLLCDHDTLTYTPTRRIHTTFEKMMVPERSIGGNFRKYWFIGFLERINSMDETPLGPQAWEIFLRLYRDNLEVTYGDFLGLIKRAAELPNDLNQIMLTDKDKEVLEDPDKIHYKYLENEISPEVYQSITTKIMYPLYEHIVKKYYTGHIM